MTESSEGSEEDQWQADKEECLSRFRSAVLAAQRGNFAPGKILIERVRARGGDQMAEIARRELRKHSGVSG